MQKIFINPPKSVHTQREQCSLTFEAQVMKLGNLGLAEKNACTGYCNCLILALILALTYSSRLYNSHTMNFHAHIYVIGETMFYELKTRGEAQRNVS